jgi:hypothetical protein
MTVKDFHDVSAQTIHDPPHRAMSRAPASHNVTTTLLGFTVAAAVLAVLWAFYVYG